MPRFFFDFSDGNGFDQDDTGVELAHVEEAHKQVVSTLPEVARGLLVDGGDHLEIAIRVRDEAGRQVLLAKLTFVAERPAQPPPDAQG